MTREQATRWVELIAGKFDQREDAEQALAELGVCETDASCILDMIDMAYSRAVMRSIGMRRRNMVSNVDDDPIFSAALEHFQKVITPAPARPWWKFW